MLTINLLTSGTLYDIPAAKRAQIASKIAVKSNWDELGLQFDNELGVTFSRGTLVAEKREHATPVTLVKHLIEKLAGRLLPVASFKKVLIRVWQML